MSYYIHGIVAKTFEFNEQRMGLFTLGELGDDVALIFKTGIDDYKKGILHIATDIRLVIDYDHQTHWLVKSAYLTIFEMDNPDIFTRGATRRALFQLGECYHINQAHAYAQFNALLEKNDLPTVPGEMQPEVGYLPAFHAFLKKHNTLSKK